MPGDYHFSESARQLPFLFSRLKLAAYFSLFVFVVTCSTHLQHSVVKTKKNQVWRRWDQHHPTHFLMLQRIFLCQFLKSYLFFLRTKLPLKRCLISFSLLIFLTVKWLPTIQKILTSIRSAWFKVRNLLKTFFI